MNTRHIAREVFAFLMIGLLIGLASEETKIVEQTNNAQEEMAIPTPNLKSNESQVTLLSQPPNKCFDVKFPIQIINPDGSLQIVDSDIALDQFILDWFEYNPNSNNEPTFSYPFEVTFLDGQQMIINSEAEFLIIADACDQQILKANQEGEKEKEIPVIGA